MGFWKLIWRLSGWSFDINVNLPDKCVICVAPHTSNWDFIVGLMAYRSIGRKANFLMKDFWFFFPLKYLLHYLGGIPVKRSKGGPSVTQYVVELFKRKSYVNIAVTPEGTRKKTDKWKTGFLYISLEANVPILLALIDYKHKKVIIDKEFRPTGEIEKDLSYVKDYYSGFKEISKYPDKFTV